MLYMDKMILVETLLLFNYDFLKTLVFAFGWPPFHDEFPHTQRVARHDWSGYSDAFANLIFRQSRLLYMLRNNIDSKTTIQKLFPRFRTNFHDSDFSAPTQT